MSNDLGAARPRCCAGSTPPSPACHSNTCPQPVTSWPPAEDTAQIGLVQGLVRAGEGWLVDFGYASVRIGDDGAVGEPLHTPGLRLLGWRDGLSVYIGLDHWTPYVHRHGAWLDTLPVEVGFVFFEVLEQGFCQDLTTGVVEI